VIHDYIIEMLVNQRLAELRAQADLERLTRSSRTQRRNLRRAKRSGESSATAPFLSRARIA
jgi:hypothetical protein